MNFKKHSKDFNKRWKIIPSDSPKESFQQFKQRVLNIFKNIKSDRHILGILQTGIDEIVTKKSIFDFCQNLSIDIKWRQRQIIIYFEEYSTNIIDYLNNEDNEKKFYKSIEIIFMLDFIEHHKQKKSTLLNEVKEAVDMSNLNITATKTENGIILYPKGEEKLDEELVNKIFSFLDKESSKDFEKALKFYDRKNFRESANNLQSSLENYLRYRLKNKKGIKENINTVQKNLKEIKNPSEIRNIIATIFDYLNKYFDDNSKHWDKVMEPENEFLIYQTGLLLRYIDRAIPQDKKSAETESQPKEKKI